MISFNLYNLARRFYYAPVHREGTNSERVAIITYPKPRSQQTGIWVHLGNPNPGPSDFKIHAVNNCSVIIAKQQAECGTRRVDRVKWGAEDRRK